MKSVMATKAAFKYAMAHHEEFLGYGKWVVRNMITVTGPDGAVVSGSAIPSLQADFLANDFAVFMSMGARMKKTKYVLAGVWIGGTLMYMWMNPKRARKKGLDREVGPCVECDGVMTSKDEMLPDYPGLYQCPKCGHPNGPFGK